MMSEKGDNLVKLEELRALGITVALDDFGTGYSSMNIFMKCPLMYLRLINPL